jgi:PAS domain S-box-containing protein
MGKASALDDGPAGAHESGLIEERDRLRRRVAELEQVADRREQTEAALRESEQRFRRIFEDSAVASALVGPDGDGLDSCYLKVNRAFCEMLGYSEQDLLGMTIADITHPEDLQPNASLREDAKDGALETFQLEKRYIHKNGEVIWADLSATVFRDEEGRFLYSIGQHQNITERKAAEEMLRVTQFSIDRAGDWVLWIGPDRRLVYVNDTACRSLGYSRDQLLSMTISDIDPDVPPEVWPRAWNRIRTKSPYTFEARHQNSKGDIIPVEVSIFHLEYGDREMACSFSRDITLRARSQEALRRAKEEAERANAAKSRFLAAANHDLRQPLQTLSLNLASLESLDDPQDWPDVVRDMEGAIESMGGLLDTLLDIERLEEGRIRLDVTAVDLDRLFARVRREFAAQARDKRLELRVVPSSLTVLSDPALLERVIQNLISNALRYTAQGRILLGCRRRGRRCRIEVWDTGVGMPEHALATIFEDYYQLDNPARDRRKGLGLGLAIVRRITDLLDHQIEVRSTLDQGSVFALEVPLVGAGEARRPALAPDEDPDPAVTGATVMAIEDDSALLQSIGRLLPAWGIAVIAESTSEAALSEALRRALTPELLLVDYRLPQGRNGIDEVMRVRGELGVEIPAIIVTGDTDPGITLEIEARGLQVAHKPVRPARLRALMASLLAKDPPEPPLSR